MNMFCWMESIYKVENVDYQLQFRFFSRKLLYIVYIYSSVRTIAAATMNILNWNSKYKLDSQIEWSRLFLTSNYDRRPHCRVCVRQSKDTCKLAQNAGSFLYNK